MSASQYRKHRVQQACEREQANLESLLQTVLEECRNLRRNQALLHEKLDQVSGHVNQLRFQQVKSLGWSLLAEGWADAAGQGNGLTNSPSAQCQVEKTLWKPLARKAVTVQTDLVGNEFDLGGCSVCKLRGWSKVTRGGDEGLLAGSWGAFMAFHTGAGHEARLVFAHRTRLSPNPMVWNARCVGGRPSLAKLLPAQVFWGRPFSCHVGRWHLPLHQ